MQINKKLIAFNFNKGGNSKKYIVVHDTGNKAATANAESHYKYFNSGNVGMSAHFAVDDVQVIQLVEEADRAWHAGVKYGTASRPEVNNTNSISIEICVNNGGNYQKAYNNAVELVAYLMQLHGISIDNVVRHYDACAKNCPASMAGNDWQLWKQFKQAVLNGGAVPVEVVTNTAPDNPTLRKGDTGEAVKDMQELLTAVGYPLTVDGDFGTKTEEALKAFQKANGLTVDGICGPNTWAALRDYNKQITTSDAGVQATSYKGFTNTDAALKILELVKPNALSVGLFPSVKAAQMVLESNYLKSELAQNANNCFGMKKTLSINSWSGSAWDGVSTYIKETQEQKPDGTPYTITAEFRKYACVEDSIADHSAYLLGAKNGNALRYEGITKAKDYREQIAIIKDGGYATDVNYITKVCGIIKQFGLDKYDGGTAIAPEVDAAIGVLMSHGVITGREYWVNAVKSGLIEYLGQLLINIAGKLQQA